MDGWDSVDILTFEKLMTRFAEGVVNAADDRADPRASPQHQPTEQNVENR
jgi:hypothetical protein